MRYCISIFFMGLAISSPASGNPQGNEQVTLESALAEALARNPDLLAERARLRIVDAGLITSRLRPNPALTVTADHLDLLGTRFSELNGAGPSELSLATEFTWERSGKRDRRVEVALKERAVAEYELSDAIRRLTFDVQSAFVDVLLAQASLGLARENLAALVRIAEINEARVKSGDLAEVELMRIRVAVLGQQNEVGQVDLTLRSARSRLSLLMGRAGPGRAWEAGGVFRAEREPRTFDDIQQTAMARRPDLKAAMAAEERARADVRLQLANSRGDVTFGTEYRRQQGINAAGNSLGFTASLPIPLFDRNQGEVARARSEAARAELLTAAVRANVAAEIRTALDQHETARAQLERIESDMLAQARRMREIIRYSYERGEASLLQLLDAERAYNETMQGLARARAEYARSLYLMDAVSGKGVQP